ncbi:MAG: hypothetical protein AAGA56_09865, partial [Myxococcota bacterium]
MGRPLAVGDDRRALGTEVCRPGEDGGAPEWEERQGGAPGSVGRSAPGRLVPGRLGVGVPVPGRLERDGWLDRACPALEDRSSDGRSDEFEGRGEVRARRGATEAGGSSLVP